jgi:hypothetical protein
MINNRFPKRNDKLLQKRQRTEGPAAKDDKDITNGLNYNNFEKNLTKTNPRMAGSKNPRLEKQDKKGNN